MSDEAPRVAVSERVFRTLIAEILAGRHGPGEKLPTQRELAARLGVNMAPVREAIKRLEQLRLLEVRHGDAMRVLDWRTHGGLDVLAHVVFRAGELDDRILRSVLEARRSFLMGAAWMAAERARENDVARIAELALEIAHVATPEQAQALDFAFYAALVEASGNLVYTLVMNSIRSLIMAEPELFLPFVARHEELAPLYARAAEAVASHDPSQAIAAVRDLASAQEELVLEAVAGVGPGLDATPEPAP